jgi:hypothetical protein
MKIMGKNDAEARKILAAWKKSNALIDGSYVSPQAARARQRIIVNQTKAAEILGLLWTRP